MHSREFDPSSLPPPLRSLYLRWKLARADRPLPNLSQIKIHSVLSETDAVALAEVLRNDQGAPTDFRILFINAKLRQNSSKDLIGKRFSTMPDKSEGSQIWGAHMACAQSGAALRVTLPYVGPTARFTSALNIFLPLACAETGSPAQTAYVLSGVWLQ